MRSSLLDLLVCPVDGSPLTFAGDGGPERISDGVLESAGGARYQVVDDIPRLLPDDTVGQTETAESFSAKWSLVSPEEVAQRFRLQHDWYDERYGFDGDQGLSEFLSGARSILEAGTGLGGDAARFARLAPHARVVAIDLSLGIEAAFKSFGDAPNLDFARADIMQLPFRPASFDFISSDQVIHHTPDAARAFSRLAELLREDGVLAVYVYRRKAPLRELADDWIRERSTRMDIDGCMELSQELAELGRALSETGATVTLERGVPLLGIDPGTHDVQRLIYWHFLKCFWNEGFSENLNALVNFDWYHPQHATRHTPEEVEGWCEANGLVVERLDVSEAGISVLARRPGSAV